MMHVRADDPALEEDQRLIEQARQRVRYMHEESAAKLHSQDAVGAAGGGRSGAWTGGGGRREEQGEEGWWNRLSAPKTPTEGDAGCEKSCLHKRNTPRHPLALLC